MWGRSWGRGFLLALVLPAVWAATSVTSPAVEAAGTGVITAGPGNMPEASQTHLKPGDIISVGYDLSVMGAHPTDTFYVEHAVATIKLGCNPSNALWTLQISMSDGPYSVPSGYSRNGGWVTTDQQSSYTTYQGKAPIPNGDQCSNNKLQPVNNGVSFSAVLQSPGDTTSPVHLQFHAIDANANGSQGNIYCGNSSQNPVTNEQTLAGTPACSSAFDLFDARPATAGTYGATTAPPPTTPKPAPPPPSPKPSTSGVHPVVVKPGSSKGSVPTASGTSAASLSGHAAGGSSAGGPTPFQPDSIATPTPLPSTPPVVIGSGGVVGPAPLLVSISTNWVPLIIVVALLILVVVALAVTSRRRRRNELPVTPPVIGHF
jgi:hypothetical protein